MAHGSCNQENVVGLHDEFSSLFGYNRRSADHDGVPDRRMNPRIRDHIFVFLQASGQDRSGSVQAVTNDISSGGLCFDTTATLHQGDDMTIEMYAPLDYHKRVLESMYIKAKVAWVSSLAFEAEGNRFRVGLSYQDIAASDKEKLARYVEDGFVERRY
jgi:hypothetical protein